MAKRRKHHNWFTLFGRVHGAGHSADVVPTNPINARPPAKD